MEPDPIPRHNDALRGFGLLAGFEGRGTSLATSKRPGLYANGSIDVEPMAVATDDECDY